MSEYRYVSTNILTGEVLCDALPLVVQSCSRQINQVGSLSGALQLGAGNASQVRDWVSALEPWKSVVWVLQDGYPVWNGVVTGQPHSSILDGTLPVQAATIEEVFKHRQISEVIEYISTDVFEIFRGLMNYALAKTPNGRVAGTGRYATSSGVVDSFEYSGVLASVTQQADYTKVYDAWGNLVSTYNLEYTLAPDMTTDGALYTRARLGLPALGRKYAHTKLSFVFPSQGFLDYQWQRGASGTTANKIVVTGSGSVGTFVSQYAAADGSHGVDTAELAAGYPLLEDSASYNGTVTSQSQVNAYADGLLGQSSIYASITPVLLLGGDAWPKVRDVQLGDECMFAATSPLHPADPATGGPGVMAMFRVSGWTLTPPSAGVPEQTSYQLGAVVPESLKTAVTG